MDPDVLEDLLKEPEEYRQPDIDTLQERNDRLRRGLRIMARAFAATKIELETTRAAIGYYDKHFRFLALPQEIRDKIYEYALVPPSRTVSPEARLEDLSNLEDPHWLPPTPGMLLVNKQISLESTEILYSKNGFKFFKPNDLLTFEKAIGIRNRDFIQQILIYLEDQDKYPVIYLETIPQYNWKALPFHWSRALMRSTLENIIEMTVSINNPTMSDSNDQKITRHLEENIKKFLARNPTPKSKPRLTLSGFSRSECDKFPKDWDVKFDEWDIEKCYTIYP